MAAYCIPCTELSVQAGWLYYNNKLYVSLVLQLLYIVSFGQWRIQSNNSTQTRHVFVKHGCPRRQQSPIMAKISKSYILTLPPPGGGGGGGGGRVMSVKCEQPLDELTVQVW